MKDYTRKANNINKIRKMVPSRRRGAETGYEGRRPFSENIFFSLHGDSQVGQHPPKNVRQLYTEKTEWQGRERR